MDHVLRFALALALALSAAPATTAETDNRGFLDRSPVLIGSEQDFPLSMLGPEMPPKGKIVPDFDGSSVRSDGFLSNGAAVQPGLSTVFTTVRVGAIAGLANAWSTAVSIPWKQISIRGTIGGQQATRTVLGLGGITLLGKRLVWRGDTDRVVASFGLELPTGTSAASFNEVNSVTTAYYGIPRLPLSWQPSSGTLNGYLAAAYRKMHGRLSYAALLAGKLHTQGDQDVTIGSIVILSVNGTYGVARDVAFALGLTYRAQGNDSYPNAPPPGVDQPALAGTTTHGSTLTLDPSVRFSVMGRAVVGIGFRTLLVRPDNGMVPQAQVYFIFYPSL